MKLELPFAIVLLAIGGALWVHNQQRADPFKTPTKNDRPTETTGQNDIAIRASAAPLLTAPTTQPVDHGVALVAWLEPVSGDSEPGSFQFKSFTPSAESPGALLAQAADRLERSFAISCNVRIKVNLFDEVVQGEGFLVHAGGASNRSRLELAWPIADESEFLTSQICDGSFYYRIEELRGERQIEFIDLSQIRTGQTSPGSTPTDWFAQASLVSLLRNLGSAFEYSDPENIEVGGVQMVRLRGRWKADALPNVLASHEPATATQNFPAWDATPPQLPHAVEIYLDNDSFLQGFPWRVTFFRFDQDQNAHPSMSMELFEPRKLAALPDNTFRVNTDNARHIDISRAYRKRLDDIIESAAVAEAGLLSTDKASAIKR